MENLRQKPPPEKLFSPFIYISWNTPPFPSNQAMASSSSSVQTVVLGRSTKSYFSTHFSDASNTQERAVFFRIFIGGSVTVILALLSIFSIYWGALWKIPAHQLDGWVVNFDGSGEIGTAFTQGLLSSSSGSLKWELRDDLPVLANVGDMIREEKAWFAVVSTFFSSIPLKRPD